MSVLARFVAYPTRVGCRAFASRADRRRKHKRLLNKQAHKQKKMFDFTHEKYMRHKDPNTSFMEPEAEGWKIIVGMAIERTPRLRQFDPSWTVEWHNHQDTLDRYRKKMIPLDLLVSKKDQAEEDQRVFHPNPRITDEDVEDDRRSLHRAMDTSTFLLVKKNGQWGFPEAEWHHSETIRETAENMSEAVCGSDLDHYLLGNAPIAHEVCEERKIKWFLMHNLFLGGNCELSNVEDFAWATKYEFPEYFKDPKRLELLSHVFYCA